MKYDLIIIRYGEIALKAKYTRNYFEHILIRNIKKALNTENIINKIDKEWGRLYLKTKNIEESILILSRIFGVVSVSPAIKISTDLNFISEKVCKITKNILTKNNSFALRVNRVGNHDFTSQDIAIKVGDQIVKKISSKVDLTNPDFEIFIDIRENNTYIFIEKIPGIGGMPIGSQNNILAIIEDKYSILSSWYLLKRGCKIIFYIKNLKLQKDLIKFCNNWFVNKNIIIKNDKENEILDISNIISKNSCYAILTGDNINNNLNSIDKISELKNIHKLPILSPLIVMKDEEINKKLEIIGL